MKRIVLVGALALGVAGCSQKGAGVESGSDDVGASAAAAASADGWSADTLSSAMDGEYRTATKSFAFPQASTEFNVTFSCAIQSKALTFTIESFVGDPQTPDERSAFRSLGDQFAGDPRARLGLMMPDGRVKFSGDPEDLYQYFGIDSDYRNRIAYTFSNGSPQMNRLAGVDQAQGVPYPSSKLNKAAALLQSLPMVVEVANGAGKFELEIGSAPAVTEVLHACGASGPVVVGAGADPTEFAEPQSTTPAAEVPEAASAAPTKLLAPSFDCAKASTVVERMICADSSLGNLDGVLAQNYRAMLAADIGDGARGALKQSQRDWNARKNACDDVECVRALYLTRVDEVCDIPVLGGAHPECKTSESL